MSFQKKYPNIYSTFESLINSRQESKDFICHLGAAYSAIENESGDDFNENWSKLYNNKVVHKHPLFELLLYYIPLPKFNLIPPYLDVLEQALSNNNIVFENKTNKIKSLFTKNSFRGTCVELILATILENNGYNVQILGDSNQKHPDIIVALENLNINIEVSQREYKVNPRHPTKTLIKKLREEGKQLLNSKGYNIVVLFFDHVLNLGKQLSPHEIFTCFRVYDSLYYYEDHKKYFVLDTNKELQHISAVGFFLNWQAPLENLGKQSGMFMHRAKESSPQEAVELLNKIKL